MALPTDTATPWTNGFDLPSRLFGDDGRSDYELYEEDDGFVLTVEMPGFDSEEIDLAWDDGVLNVAAEHVAGDRNRRRTYRRQFRFPQKVDEDAIDATYTNGVLEVTLPFEEDGTAPGKTIPIES